MIRLMKNRSSLLKRRGEGDHKLAFFLSEFTNHQNLYKMKRRYLFMKTEEKKGIVVMDEDTKKFYGYVIQPIYLLTLQFFP